MLRVSAAQRLDQWIVAHGYAATREEAQAAIMAGDVTVDGVVADKAGRRMPPGARVAIRRPAHSYASRGGLKLAHALAAFGIDPRERTAVDLGASTGGFTDCLLQAGAARVYAVDVGRGQLAWRLRTDPRVVCLEGVNARHLTPAQVGGPCDLVTVDLAFISLRLVWKAIAALVRPGGDVIALIKPQFEAGRAHVGRGGVVRDPTVHEAVLRSALDTAAAAGLVPLALTPSPVTGPAGNIEYLVHLRPAPAASASVDVAAVVGDAQARFPNARIPLRRRRP
ncbi:MAG TPA: TlyA family RNA methyltransferase [bacterium]|nr:TlyA family RNA methyltransferase [bacterium]